MNSTHHLGQTRRVAANCYDHKSTGHRLRHVPNFMSQIGPRDRLYVSTRTRFVSHGDVSPLVMVRGVTTFMSATKKPGVWAEKVASEMCEHLQSWSIIGSGIQGIIERVAGGLRLQTPAHFEAVSHVTRRGLLRKPPATHNADAHTTAEMIVCTRPTMP